MGLFFDSGRKLPFMFSKGTRVLYFLRKKEYQIITTEEIFHLIAELPFILFMDLVVHDAGLP